MLKVLVNEYRSLVISRYKLDEEEVQRILELDAEENEKILEIMHLIGKKRGALRSGGEIDEEKTAKIILEDFRSGKIGRITLEKPENKAK